MAFTLTTKLLLVDDDPSIVRLLSTVISDALGGEIQIESLTDPAEALDCIDQGGIDILLTDLDMPHIDGLDLLRAAKRRNSSTQVLFITGQSSGDALMKALDDGATDYLLKPVDHSVLVELVSQAHHRHRRWRTALIETLRQRREKTLVTS